MAGIYTRRFSVSGITCLWGESSVWKKEGPAVKCGRLNVHVHAAEVVAGAGVYECPKNLWATSCALEGRNDASSTVRGPTVLEWPLNLTVIWPSSVGVWKPFLIVMKWTSVMMLKIIHGTVKQLRARIYAALSLLSTREEIFRPLAL